MQRKIKELMIDKAIKVILGYGSCPRNGCVDGSCADCWYDFLKTEALCEAGIPQKIDENFTVTITQALFDKIGVKKGDTVILRVEGEAIIIEKSEEE